MRNKLITLAGALALVAVIGKFYAPPVLAQVRAALVKNVDEPGRVPYQALPSSSANFLAIQYLYFPPVPAGKRLVITFVSGFTSFGSNTFGPGGARVYAVPSTANNCCDLPGPFAVLSTFATSTVSANFSAPIHFYVEEGLTPAIKAFAPVPLTSAEFTIVGYLIDKSN